MIRNVKKSIITMLGLLLIVSLVAACSAGSNTNTASEAGEPSGTEQSPQLTSNGIDISKHVDLKMFLIGDKPADFDNVYDKLNALIKQDLNASLRVEFLPFSDWTQRYPLLFASGDAVDLIYTSDWAMYDQEATKGAFAEVTEEILEKYMPETNKQQTKVSFDQAKINGKAYFVPNDKSAVSNANVIVIRGDLREKYGLPEIKSISDLEAYYDAIAKNEKGIFPYAASQNNNELRSIMLTTLNEMFTINYYSDYYHPLAESELSTPTISWIYGSEPYKIWVEKMKEWADKGYWSKNAISNKTQPRDAFENGTSASLIWNLGTVSMTAQKVQQEHPDWKPEIYDIGEQTIKFLSRFTGDGMAVATASKHKERAFMLLDKMKFDRKYNELMRMGVEGEHWIAVDDNKWEAGPKQDRYPFGSGGTWGVKSENYERTSVTQPEIITVINDKWLEKVKQPATSGFRLDESKIKTELAAVNSAKSKYIPLLELGLVDDVEKVLEQYKAEVMKVGQEKIESEINTQLQQYLDSLK
ncbi:extracellular solute-binding protein [Paenibacillus yanchengensis]|uniref:Extracellular solute-binding protein n=1 Tax=Paenibacillus yanchengensis TaxID=2035833 RepID=A0ABW4YQ13_9BACL